MEQDPEKLIGQWMTLDEAAAALQVSRPTIGNLIKAGKLQAYKIGKRAWRIYKPDFLNYIASTGTQKMLTVGDPIESPFVILAATSGKDGDK